MTDEPLSEWMYVGKPQKENIWSKHFTTVVELISGQGKANEYREYLSMTVNRYLFLDLDGNGPLKSILGRSIERIYLINSQTFENR